MLPSALGGLCFRVPPVPGRHAPGSMVKIKLSCGHPQDDEIILHSPFRRQIAKLKIKAEMKIHGNEITVRTKSRRICRAGAEGAFRRNAISRESPVHQRQVGGLEPTVAREHVCGPDVISTATVNGAREGARVEIMSVGCPQTAGRASRSGQVPDYLSRNTASAYAPAPAAGLCAISRGRLLTAVRNRPTTSPSRRRPLQSASS